MIITIMTKKTKDIVICMGSSCFSRGNKNTLLIVKSYLKDHSLDDHIVFRGAHCTDNCDKGPVLVINGSLLTKVRPDEVIGLLDKHLVNDNQTDEQ